MLLVDICTDQTHRLQQIEKWFNRRCQSIIAKVVFESFKIRFFSTICHQSFDTLNKVIENNFPNRNNFLVEIYLCGFKCFKCFKCPVLHCGKCNLSFQLLCIEIPRNAFKKISNHNSKTTSDYVNRLVSDRMNRSASASLKFIITFLLFNTDLSYFHRSLSTIDNQQWMLNVT